MIRLFLHRVGFGVAIAMALTLLADSGVSADQQEKKENGFDGLITYADDVNVDPHNFWPDSNLKTVFAKYWQLRFEGESEEAFAIEAPYFQEMANFNRYRQFTKKNPHKLVELKMRGRDQRTERLHLIHCTARLKDSNGVIQNFFFVDQWIFFDNQWYHVWRDRLIFPGLS